MTTWSPARPVRLGDRCKYTKRCEETLRAQFKHLLGRRGVVRMVRGTVAHVRWDDRSGHLEPVSLWDLVLEAHTGPDPLEGSPTTMMIYDLDRGAYVPIEEEI